MHLFHDWEYIYRKGKSKFLGDEYITYYKKFRVCRKCGKAQELHWSTVDVFWETLDEERKKILNKKIVEENGIRLVVA